MESFYSLSASCVERTCRHLVKRFLGIECPVSVCSCFAFGEQVKIKTSHGWLPLPEGKEVLEDKEPKTVVRLLCNYDLKTVFSRRTNSETVFCHVNPLKGSTCKTSDFGLVLNGGYLNGLAALMLGGKI